MSKRQSRIDPERKRLEEDASRKRNWKRWGPYLSERQWGTVREDYSADGSSWDSFPHDHARSRAYRWGEDGLLGITDRQCRICFALALWNGHDPILKERLFGLTGPEGNHAEDVKECYYYLDATPTHSYLKALYKYPAIAFPYQRLVEENRRRSKVEREFELLDTGVFEEGGFDVLAEYAKAGPDDILIRITITNHGREEASLRVLPTLWCRNTWMWGCSHEGCEPKPYMRRGDRQRVVVDHKTLGRFSLVAGVGPTGEAPDLIFCENETNLKKVFGVEGGTRYPKDALHRYVVHGQADAVNPRHQGTKAAADYQLTVGAGQSISLKLRLHAESEATSEPLGEDFDEIVSRRIQEADRFYETVIPDDHCPERKRVARQAYAGLIWTKQFYHYSVLDWLEGDQGQPPPPEQRLEGRNREWRHLFNRDVLSMPDKWEYPWFAAWDSAFHMIPFSEIDPDFARDQLLLFLREWYMHPNGQIPAYEFDFSDVNPPVHAWACWDVYRLTGTEGQRDRRFLQRAFHKLLINFTWWVNRKDPRGQHLFAGGFLGLDNIGLFDRSQPIAADAFLEQADGTAWMAFYCSMMLNMAMELAAGDPAYEDVASKFFEHFVAIADAMNHMGGSGLWNEEDGFYYDQLIVGQAPPRQLRVRSLVGILPLLAVGLLDHDLVDRLPRFKKRMEWFLDNRRDLSGQIACMLANKNHNALLLAIPNRERLEKALRYVLDEGEFLSPYGIRSLSAAYRDEPYRLHLHGQEYAIRYVPGESETYMFGGNSNWRGPVWFPINYLLVEALERYHAFYGDDLKVELPTGSGHWVTLDQAAAEISARLSRLFLPDESGVRPCHGMEPRYARDPAWKDLVLFYEHFDGDCGRGLGASHQTGWTAMVTSLLRRCSGSGGEGGH
ncbi:MAG: glucosidase [Phycisphaeraceae bacterium]|nr:glucosidase [Phycisphaeraceae bacterium]